MRLLPSLGGERSLSRKPDGPDTLGAVRFLRRAIPPTEKSVGRTWSQFSLGDTADQLGERRQRGLGQRGVAAERAVLEAVVEGGREVASGRERAGMGHAAQAQRAL